MTRAFIIAALALSGCAQLTGDPIRDCRDATNMASAANAASILAGVNADANPQSARMQQLAALSQAALTIANGQTATACAVVK